MKRVDGKLLEKYYAGRCTPEEKKMVQAWLQSGEYDEAADLPEDLKTAQKEQMWQSIEAGIGFEPPAINTTPLYKKVIRYAAAACLAFLLVGAGYFFGINNSTGDKQIVSHESDGQLYISSQYGKTTKVEGARFQLRFDGSIHLFNASRSEIMIFVEGKGQVLEPLQAYYLRGTDKNAHIIQESKLPYGVSRDFERFLKGDFSVHKI